MPYRPIQWAKRSIEGRQVEADGSRLLDFYPVQLPDPTDAKVPVMLLSTPGHRRYLKVPDRNTAQGRSVDSGVHALLGVGTPAYGTHLFGLIGQYYFFHARYGSGHDLPERYDPTGPGGTVMTLPSTNIEQFSTETEFSFPAGTPTKLVTDGRRVLFAHKSEVFIYDLGKSGAAGFISVVAPRAADLSTLEDLAEQNWVDCAWVDNYFLLAAKSGQFFHSLLDSTQFDQLDFSEAGTNPDEIVGMEILNRRIYIIGTQTVEQWFNAGGADFAFSRDNSFTLQIGCVAKASIATNLFAIMFLGSDGICYALSGANARRISTESVEYDIARSRQDLARGYTYTEEGHRFYSLVLHIDGARKNWTYDFTVAVWHERAETDIVCVERFQGRTLVGKDGAQHIFDQRLAWGSIDDDASGDSAVRREAISPVLFSSLQRIIMSSFQVDIPIRPGPADDEILIEWSDDGQKTWKGGTNLDGLSRAMELDGGPRFRVNRMGQYREGRNIRLSTSARRRVDVLGAYVDVDVLPD